MRRKPTDSPYQSGEWPVACGNQKSVPLLWAIAFIIGVAVLAHMVVRFAGWLGSR